MKYDYRVTKTPDNIIAVFDSMNGRQLQRVADLVEDMRQKERRERADDRAKWIDQTLLFLLKRYAEQSCSLLEMQEVDGKLHVILKNKVGFIVSDCKELQLAMQTADYAVFGEDDGELMLLLIYDYAA